MVESTRAPASEPDQGPRWARAFTRRVQRSAAPPEELAAAVTARTTGQGPDVVLVPGLAVSNYLMGVQARLAESARVHLLELPGAGAGMTARGAPTLRQDAAALTGWLRTELRAPAVVVGHSYGTQVVARSAAADTALVRAVVLASPTVDPAVRSGLRLLRSWRRDQATQPAGLAEVNRPQQDRTGKARVLALVVSMLADDLGHWLVQVDAPVTVLVGTGDAFGTQEWGRSLVDRPGGTFVAVPGGTHTFPFDHPDALVTAVHDIRGEDEHR